MFNAKIYTLLGSLVLSLTLNQALAQVKDPTIFYMLDGISVNPWEASLHFGTEKITDGKAQTFRSSLQLLQQKDSVKLIWSPKSVKNEWGSVDRNLLTFNLINRVKHVDISSVEEQASLVLEIKVNRAPKELVEITLECDWDWECRSKFPLRNILRKVPKDQWLSIPIPLQCFSNKNFDFSKLTGLMMTTEGKMELELRSIKLAGLPQNFDGC